MKELLNDPKLKPYIKKDTKVEEITEGMSGSKVYRIINKEESTILKVTSKSEVPDYLNERNPHFHLTELIFYKNILSKVDNSIYIDGDFLSNGGTYLILKDLSSQYDFLNENHMWNEEELSLVLNFYAKIHAFGMEYFKNYDGDNLFDVDIRDKYKPDKVYNHFKELYTNKWTHEMVKPLFESKKLYPLIKKVLTVIKDSNQTIIYNDFYPLNVGINKNKKDAIIIDWQLASRGFCHADIADIGFLEQSESFQQINKEKMLKHYLDQLSKNTSKSYDYKIFYKEYQYAKLLRWGVFLSNIVLVMNKINQKNGNAFGDWMNKEFHKCINDWKKELSLD